MKGKCFDVNPKVVVRTYSFYGNIDEFALCELHCNDPDFSNFISEIPINQEVIQN